MDASCCNRGRGRERDILSDIKTDGELRQRDREERERESLGKNETQ